MTLSPFRELKSCLKYCFPQNKREKILLLIFFLFYLSYSTFLTLNSSIIDYHKVSYDLYFSFDNPAFFYNGYSYFEGHPLMPLLSKPFMLIANILLSLFGLKSKTIFFITICNLFVSLSIVYTYRYLIEIIEIKKNIAYILTVFFGFTSTNLILCFTPESFNISLCIITFFILYYSYNIKNNRQTSFLINILTSIILGGVTITNYAKGVILILFSNVTKKIIVKRLFIMLLISFILLIYLQYFYNIIGLIEERISCNAEANYTIRSYLNNIYKNLLATPILFSKLIITIPRNQINNQISFGEYENLFQYSFCFCIIILSIISIFLNLKNRYVQL